MRLFFLDLAAKVMGLQIRIGEIPYGKAEDVSKTSEASEACVKPLFGSLKGAVSGRANIKPANN